MKNLLSILSVFTLFYSCAKKRDYEEVYKDAKLITRSEAVDTESDHLYLVSTLGAPRLVASALPYYQGEEKIVRMKFEKKGLHIYQLDKDKRFSDNPLNNSPVLTIPGDYNCLLYTSPSPRDRQKSRMPSSA